MYAVPIPAPRLGAGPPLTNLAIPLSSWLKAKPGRGICRGEEVIRDSLQNLGGVDTTLPTPDLIDALRAATKQLQNTASNLQAGPTKGLPGEDR